jgi:hypothetical protein
MANQVWSLELRNGLHLQSQHPLLTRCHSIFDSPFMVPINLISALA